MYRIIVFFVTLSFSLTLWAQNTKKVIIRLCSEAPEEIISAVDSFEQADIPFTMERTVRNDDSFEMKGALAKVQWKNNELVPKIVSLPEIEIVDVTEENMMQVINQAKKEGWQVKVPSEWRRLLRYGERSFGGRNYYVCADGDDSSDGLTPATAWRSLSKVNEVMLGYADTVRFHAGDVFRGYLLPQSGKPGASVVYTYYGEGEKPVLEPSWDASSVKDWVKVGPRLWKCEKPSENELGNIIFNHGDAGCAWKVDSLNQLQGRDLFFCWVKDEKAVYLVSRKNPARRFYSIELAEKHHIISEGNAHDIEYEGLWLRYGAAHGIGGGNTSNIVVRSCDISWIGGSTLYIDEGGRGVRYGNGIEFWGNTSNILVENCRVWECWDAALTNQSNVVGSVQENIIWRNNTIWNSEYSYEYWQQGDGCITRNIVFENNTCHGAGYGWGHEQRWNPNAAHLMFYDSTAATDGFFICGNRFEETKDCGIRLFNAWYDRITAKDNTWIIPSNYLIRYHGRPTSNLIYKYPDHLDKIHMDSEEEIQSQTVESPLKLRGGERDLRIFQEKFGL